MPVWALVMALVISAIYTVPVGIIQAITNQQIALNVVTELIVGYALPGKPIAMMMFKVSRLRSVLHHGKDLTASGGVLDLGIHCESLTNFTTTRLSLMNHS